MIKVVAFFERYVRLGQKILLWGPQWRQRILLALAFFLPGVPHMFGKKRFCSGCLLCLFGVGALATLTSGIMSFLLSGFRVYAFDIDYVSSLGNFVWMYPLEIILSIASTENLPPIREGKVLAVQPFYWELLSACIIIYIVCAAVSFWYQWKEGKAEIEKSRS